MASKPEFTVEEQNKMKKMKQGYLISMPILFAILGVIAWALIYQKLDFGRYQGIKAYTLTQLPARWEYVLRHSTLGVLWLLFCFGYVGIQRSNTPAMDPSAGYEHVTQMSKNIFLNSLEQFVMSVFSQLILVTYLEPKYVLNVIPAMNIMFFVGRVLFWWGYPHKRGIGFGLGFYPTVSALLYITYRYVRLYV